MTPIVEATRHLRTVVSQVMGVMDITQQEKRELATEVYVHAVVLMHRVMEARRCAFTLPHLVVTCAMLGCKIVIDDDCNVALYSDVTGIPYLKDVPCVAGDFVALEAAVMAALDFRLLRHLFRQ